MNSRPTLHLSTFGHLIATHDLHTTLSITNTALLGNLIYYHPIVDRSEESRLGPSGTSAKPLLTRIATQRSR